jgi:hypothetical protein
MKGEMRFGAPSAKFAQRFHCVHGEGCIDNGMKWCVGYTETP